MAAEAWHGQADEEEVPPCEGSANPEAIQEKIEGSADASKAWSRALFSPFRAKWTLKSIWWQVLQDEHSDWQNDSIIISGKQV